MPVLPRCLPGFNYVHIDQTAGNTATATRVSQVVAAIARTVLIVPLPAALALLSTPKSSVDTVDMELRRIVGLGLGAPCSPSHNLVWYT